ERAEGAGLGERRPVAVLVLDEMRRGVVHQVDDEIAGTGHGVHGGQRQASHRVTGDRSSALPKPPLAKARRTRRETSSRVAVTGAGRPGSSRWPTPRCARRQGRYDAFAASVFTEGRFSYCVLARRRL